MSIKGHVVIIVEMNFYVASVENSRISIAISGCRLSTLEILNLTHSEIKFPLIINQRIRKIHIHWIKRIKSLYNSTSCITHIECSLHTTVWRMWVFNSESSFIIYLWSSCKINIRKDLVLQLIIKEHKGVVA